jgi:hypothetical protein
LPVNIGRGVSVEVEPVRTRLASCADALAKTPINASVQSAAWSRKPMEASSKLLASLASRFGGAGTTRNPKNNLPGRSFAQVPLTGEQRCTLADLSF